MSIDAAESMKATISSEDFLNKILIIQNVLMLSNKSVDINVEEILENLDKSYLFSSSLTLETLSSYINSKLSLKCSIDDKYFKLNTAQLNELISLLQASLSEYKKHLIENIKGYESSYSTKLKEIESIEKGTLDDVLIREYEANKKVIEDVETIGVEESEEENDDDVVMDGEIGEDHEISVEDGKDEEKDEDEVVSDSKIVKEEAEEEDEEVVEKVSTKKEEVEPSEETEQNEEDSDSASKKEDEEDEEIDAGDEEPLAPTPEPVTPPNGLLSQTTSPVDDDERANAASSSPSTRKRSKSPMLPNKRFQAIANPLISNIASHRYASAFLMPVNEHDAPDYFNLIYAPTDLKTISKKIKKGEIQDIATLEREIMLMFANCLMYNKEDADLVKLARSMKDDVDNMVELFREAERGSRD